MAPEKLAPRQAGLPTPPEVKGKRHETAVVGETLHIRIREAYRMRHLVPGLIAGLALELVLVVVCFVLAGGEALPQGQIVLLVGAGVVFLVALPMLSFTTLTMLGMRRRTAVSVSPRGLGILTWPSFSPRMVVIPISDLEKLEIVAGAEDAAKGGTGECLVARAAGSAVSFGQRLTHEELVWLRDAIAAAARPR